MAEAAPPSTPKADGGGGDGDAAAEGAAVPTSPGAAPPAGDGRVKVACRVRPMSSGELSQGHQQIVVVNKEVSATTMMPHLTLRPAANYCRHRLTQPRPPTLGEYH